MPSIMACHLGCVVVGNNGGNVSFESYRVADDYKLPSADSNSWDYPVPRTDQLTAISDTILVLFYQDAVDYPRFEIIGAYRLEKQGRHIQYPLRSFIIALSGKFSAAGAGMKNLGVIAFAKDCWPAMYISGDPWDHQRGGFFNKIGGTTDFKVPLGCKAKARVILVPRTRTFEPIAVCTDMDAETDGLSTLLADADGKMAKAIANSSELTKDDRSMVFKQIHDLMETLKTVTPAQTTQPWHSSKR